MTNVQVYAPAYVAVRRIRYCYTCKQQRRMVQLLFVWHDAIGYCCTCGEEYGDKRKFTTITRERQRKIDKAISLWRGAVKWREAMKWLRERIREETAFSGQG